METLLRATVAAGGRWIGLGHPRLAFPFVEFLQGLPRRTKQLLARGLGQRMWDQGVGQAGPGPCSAVGHGMCWILLQIPFKPWCFGAGAGTPQVPWVCGVPEVGDEAGQDQGGKVGKWPLWGESRALPRPRQGLPFPFIRVRWASWGQHQTHPRTTKQRRSGWRTWANRNSFAGDGLKTKHGESGL